MLTKELKLRQQFILIGHGAGGLVAKQVVSRLAWGVSQNAELGVLAHGMVGLVLLAVPHKIRQDGMLGPLLLQQARSIDMKLPGHTIKILKKADDLHHTASLFEDSLNNVQLDTKVLSIIPVGDHAKTPRKLMSFSTSEYASKKDFSVGFRETIIEIRGGFQDACKLTLDPDQIMDVVYWVERTLAGKRSKLQEQNELARKLNLGNYDEDFDPVSAREDAKGWLAKPIKVLSQVQDIITPNEANWLLIFDNADDPKVLEGFLPSLGIGSVLITSRRARHSYKQDMRRLQINPAKIKILDLQPLHIDQGAKLIRDWTGSHSDGHIERSKEISRILGGIPLALLQCAQLLRDDDLFFQDFLTWYQRADQRHDLVSHMDDVNVRSNCLTLPSFITGALYMKAGNPTLILLTFCIAAHGGSKLKCLTKDEKLIRDRMQFEQANYSPILPFLKLAESICESVPSKDSHRILRDVWHTLGAIGTWTNDLQLALPNTKRVLEPWQREARETGVYDRNIAAGYNQHATALMTCGHLVDAEAELRTAIRILSTLEDKELASSQKLLLGYNLWLQGHLDEAEAILRNGLSIREAKFGKDDRYSYKSGAYHAALGNVTLARNDLPEAQKLHAYTMSQYEATHGKHHPGTPDIYHVMARYKVREHKFGEAIGLLNKALEIWKYDSALNRSERARSMFLKSIALRGASGPSEEDEREARCLLRDAIKLYEELTEGTHVEDRVLTEGDFDKIIMFWSR
ncbi:tetratricopeptide repeat domain-containing protein [Phlyctema vagabunda]|uniref:Tetratricopeptide repeat domain-containing protein n=1 Tax=Phlyctema vagabunda TaxID=108571 RepID=A0ABR4PSP7_9HELO